MYFFYHMVKKVKDYIRNIPNFPKPGIQFKDITPLLASPVEFKLAIDWYISQIKLTIQPDVIVGIESRGFIMGAAVAIEMGIGFIPIRKPGKLPAEVVSQTYKLEYGSDEVQIHKDAISKDMKVAIVDDLLATGGTAEATMQLIEKVGAKIVSASFLIELDQLKGRERLTDINQQHIFSLLHY